MNTIYIVGHPGAGKALIAKKVADQLGWDVIDADFGLEFRAGQTHATIIGKKGEQHFLDYQLQLLSSIAQENSIVITDGSIVCSDQNRQFLANSLVVYLQVSVAAQLQRIVRQLMPLSKPNLEEFFTQLHHERDHFYEEVSSLTIDSDDGLVDDHASRIVEFIPNKYAIHTTADLLSLEQKDLILFHYVSHVAVHLSKQQALCVKLLAQGNSSKEIALLLNISYRTVEGYLAQAMEKLGCTSSKELIALYHHRP